MQVAILYFLGAALVTFPGIAVAQSNAPADSATNYSSGPCAPTLPELDLHISAASRAMRERSIREGFLEVDLSWRTAEDDAAWDRSMPMWMRKVSKVVLDRVLLLQEKNLLISGQRHLAAQYSNQRVPVDSLARLGIEVRATARSILDAAFFQSIGGQLIRAVPDPGSPGSDVGFIDVWVPPEYLQCLAENPEVVWIHDLGVSVTH